MKTHAQGELAYVSKSLGIKVHHSLCGGTTSIKGVVLPNDAKHDDRINCKRCRASFAFNHQTVSKGA